jgi:hypothetical protein
VVAFRSFSRALRRLFAGTEAAGGGRPAPPPFAR